MWECGAECVGVCVTCVGGGGCRSGCFVDKYFIHTTFPIVMLEFRESLPMTVCTIIEKSSPPV